MKPIGCGDKVEPMSRRAKVESGARRPEVELRDPQTKADPISLEGTIKEKQRG